MPIDCEYAGDHPHIERRLMSLESWRGDMEDARQADLQAVYNKIDAVNEKVHGLALAVKDLHGRITGAVVMATATSGILLFLLDRLFRK